MRERVPLFLRGCTQLSRIQPEWIAHSRLEVPMARRIVDVVIATGILTFASLTLHIGLRLMAFHK